MRVTAARSVACRAPVPQLRSVGAAAWELSVQLPGGAVPHGTPFGPSYLENMRGADIVGMGDCVGLPRTPEEPGLQGLCITRVAGKDARETCLH